MEMKLTKQQLEHIKKQMEKLQTQLTELDKRDYESHQKRLIIKNEFEELSTIILTAESLEINNNDCIGLGSIFEATIDFDGSIENKLYLITDSGISVPGFNVSSYNSPLAKAVIGKKASDKFSYQVLNNKFNGVINSIYKGDSIESPKTMIKSK